MFTARRCSRRCRTDHRLLPSTQARVVALLTRSPISRPPWAPRPRHRAGTPRPTVAPSSTAPNSSGARTRSFPVAYSSQQSCPSEAGGDSPRATTVRCVDQSELTRSRGWRHLQTADETISSTQAVAICKVMKEYTDAGLEVWLRFAHEVKCVLPSTLCPISKAALSLTRRSPALQLLPGRWHLPGWRPGLQRRMGRGRQGMPPDRS